MSCFEIILIMVISFIMVYSLVDRICKCIENKHISNSFADFIKNASDKVDIKSIIDKTKTK